MADVLNRVEQERVELQAQLDSLKTQAERNKLGQFSTPPVLALDILSYAKSMLPSEPMRFIDPAFGTGAFYSALLKTYSEAEVQQALGFEVDAHYAEPTMRLWANNNLELKQEDYTRAFPKPLFNLLICNPPYVRHHHIDGKEKKFLQNKVREITDIKMNGLSGLYCYFIGLSHAWLSPNALSGWLIPSEFMDVNYGKAIKEYLLNKVTLLHIHRFDPNDAQFSDALVSSAIVWFKNALPPQDHRVLFTYGGGLALRKVMKFFLQAK